MAFDLHNDDLTQLTPAMRQFVEIKRRYPDQLVLYRMGDFYETFFDDAVKANRLIGITLTKRGKTADGEPIPMAGIPMVSLDSYVARLVRMGESVVVAEQVGVPGKGSTMERRISRIITPGTLTETALLPEKSDAILMAVAKASVRRRASADATVYGLVWLTLSSGDFRAAEVSEAEFESELARIAPSEVLATDALRRELRETHPEFTTTPLPDWHFDAERGAELLKKTFALETLEAWDVENSPLILAAANALLDYTTETQVDALPFILPLKRVEESEFIVIDPASRRNLEISETIRRDGPELTLFSVLDRCGSAMGSRELRRRLNQPLRLRAEAEARHEAIERLLACSEEQGTIHALVAELPDVERISSRTALGTVKPRELAALRDALPAMARLAELLEASPATLLARDAAALRFPSELGDRLNAALLEEPAAQLRDGDVIRSDFNEELARLRSLRDNTGQFLVDLETREREATGITTLRVEFNKVHGFYIEVSKAQADKVPMHYTRRQTLKNAERFITPELKSYEDQALSSKERSAQLERELFEDLVAFVSPYVPALMAAARALAGLDVLDALACHARQYGWVRPVLTDRPGIRITKGRHPVVETTIEGYVPNDCWLGECRRMLVITGPNMGGKSTYMRAAALTVLLAWAGSFVPAESAEIGPVDRIHTRIGASDDLARGRSTFMVEMTEAASILHRATDHSLVLMDEIGRGTSTYDGLSLAAAIAQSLVERNRSFTLFATHYFELTNLADELRDVVNVHVSAAQTKSRVVFLHKIEEGPASRSYGVAVAQLAGIPAPVVKRAREILKTLEAAGRTGIPGLQPDLFSTHAEENAPAGVDPKMLEPVLQTLESLVATDIDSLTPRAALDLLYAVLPALGREAERLREAIREASDI